MVRGWQGRGRQVCTGRKKKEKKIMIHYLSRSAGISQWAERCQVCSRWQLPWHHSSGNTYTYIKCTINLFYYPMSLLYNCLQGNPLMQYIRWCQIFIINMGRCLPKTNVQRRGNVLDIINSSELLILLIRPKCWVVLTLRKGQWKACSIMGRVQNAAWILDLITRS